MSDRKAPVYADGDGDGHDDVARPERCNFLRRGNDPFTCRRCGARVRPLVAGGYRNHCPECLWSRHVDVVPGDRAADCGGMMRPVSIACRHGEWFVEHACERCRFHRAGGLNFTDPEQPDCWDRAVELSSGSAEP